MVLMVGNRRATGATILGGVLEYLICQPSFLCPADGSCTSRWVVLWTVYEMACFQRGELLRQPLPSSTSLRRRYFLSYAVSSGLLEVSSYLFAPYLFPSSRPAHPALSRLCRILRWSRSDFPVGSTCSSSDHQSWQACQARPRASRSSSHRDEQWEGCRV